MKRNRRKTVKTLGPTPERMAKDDWDDASTERAGVVAKRVKIVSRYDLLRRQGKLTRDEHAACEHFESQYRAAYGADCLIARYNKGVAGGFGDGPQHALAAMRQLSTAVGARWHWLIAIIIEGQALSVTERRMHVRNGQGLSCFKAALRAMTDQWGLPNEPETERELKVDVGSVKRVH